MLNASDIRAWLAALPDDAQVSVDDGGLNLLVQDSDAYLEVGGMRDDDARQPINEHCTPAVRPPGAPRPEEVSPG
jgi:hypothetical protein